jgi:phage terminase Nu1 subunit (DNA packaging protein)
MPKDEKAKNYSALSVADVAELLCVTDRQVRNWIKDNGLSAHADPRGRLLDWPETLRWFVAYRIEQSGGSGGKPKGGAGGNEQLETMEQALARRTRAEADLKELQLATQRAQVVAIADVEKVMGAANKSIQTLALALPATLTPQLLGLADRAKVYAVLDRGVRSMLGNLASVDAVRAARQADEDEAE